MKLAKGLNDHLPSSVQTNVPCTPLASSNEPLSVCSRRCTSATMMEANVAGGGQSGLRSTCGPMTLGTVSYFPVTDCQLKTEAPVSWNFACNIYFTSHYIPSTFHGVQEFICSISICGKKE